MNKVINSIEEFCEMYGTTPDKIERTMYKYTDCGAWIKWDDKSISIGTIVEGSDAEFSRRLAFPFPYSEAEAWLEELDTLAKEAWHEANDEPEE